MTYESIEKQLQIYLKKVNNISEDRCCICYRTREELKKKFFEFAKNNDIKGADIDDIFLLTYKTKRPVCFGCYYGIKQNPELAKEIFERSEDEIWD